MIIPIKTTVLKNSYENKNHNTAVIHSVSLPNYGNIGFRAQTVGTKQAVKFLVPAILGSIGAIKFLPKLVFNKVYETELENYKYDLLELYGNSKRKEIETQLSDIKQISKVHPEKVRLIENLLRNKVFNSLGNAKYLTPDNPELFNKQLEFLNEMITEKKYAKYADARQAENPKTKQAYTIKDFEAKEIMLDYLRDFNSKYEASDRWQEDKLHSDALNIGYKQVDIINATNAFNLDLMLEIVKSKTTFIDKICPENEVTAIDIKNIGCNINEKNIDYIRQLFRDENVSRETIAGLSEWVEKKSMALYKKLNNNPDIPKKHIGEIGAILNDYNYDFVMGLAQNPNIPKDEIAQFGKYYNEYSAPVLRYLVKHLNDKRVNCYRQIIWEISSSIHKDNKEYIEKLCKNENISLEIISNVADVVNNDNFNFIVQMGENNKNFDSDIKFYLTFLTKKNRKFVETLCSKFQIKQKDFSNIMDYLYNLENTPLNQIDFVAKCGILSLHSKYGDLMKECGMDYDEKIKEIADSVQTNIECTEPESLKGFLSNILANNNPEAENLLQTYDFAQFGKNGIPLEYSRNIFVENLKENLLSGIDTERRKIILDHFGIIENDDYDGLWNNKEMVKSKLISEEEKAVSDHIKEELDKFMLRNRVVSNDENLNKILNGLIKGIPSFVPLIGKVQHGTHDYSIDIHTLKVLQSCINNPQYKDLSDEGKTVLKLSALLHDIGKNGQMRDPNHAQKSADYAEPILKTIKLSKNVKNRIINVITNHHWFADYNSNTLSPKNITAKCRLKEDLLIYQILAKADLENVSNKFHMRVTETIQ